VLARFADALFGSFFFFQSTENTMYKPGTIILDGKSYDLAFTRRRYSNTTFTWVAVNLGGQWLDLGDPWQCVTPKKSEIEAGLRIVLAAYPRLAFV